MITLAQQVDDETSDLLDRYGHGAYVRAVIKGVGDHGKGDEDYDFPPGTLSRDRLVGDGVWFWNERTRTYYQRNPITRTKTRRLLARRMDTIVREIINEQIVDGAWLDNAITDLRTGDLSSAEFERLMQRRLETLHRTFWNFASGGRVHMNSTNRRGYRTVMNNEFKMLRGFVKNVDAGKYTDKQIANYARAYVRGSRSSFQAARAAAYGVKLPAYPGSVSPCGGNCYCRTFLFETAKYVEATWVLGHRDNVCPTCRRLNREWQPLRLKRRWAINRKPVAISARRAVINRVKAVTVEPFVKNVVNPINPKRAIRIKRRRLRGKLAVKRRTTRAVRRNTVDRMMPLRVIAGRTPGPWRPDQAKKVREYRRKRFGSA